MANFGREVARHEPLLAAQKPLLIPSLLEADGFRDAADLTNYLNYSDSGAAQTPKQTPETLDDLDISLLRFTSLGGTIVDAQETFSFSRNGILYRREGIKRKLQVLTLAHAVRRGFEMDLFDPMENLDPIANLRRTELIALRAASFGVGVREAARRCGNQPKTIKNHRHQATSRLNTKNIIHAVRLGFENKLLSLDDSPDSDRLF